MSELAKDAAQRRQSGRRASALLDAEQQERINEKKAEETAENFERQANQRRASAIMDLEQAARIQKIKQDEDMNAAERGINQRRASKSMDMEQQRRISEAKASEQEANNVRRKSQEMAANLLDAEQRRRVEEVENEEKALEEERKKNQGEAVALMDEEQERRMEEKPRAKSLAAEQGVLEELQDEIDPDEDNVADVNDAKGLGQDPGSKVKVSDKASANVAEIMKADAGDESLRKYKESLLGKAANGDLGDTSDPRKVVVAEFRVVFEDKSTDDLVFNLDTEAGVGKLAAEGISIREGSGFRFELKFRVNHELLTGLKFINRIGKGIFGQTEELVIGSFAPASDPYTFIFPRYGFNTAPSGMMMRGTYQATDKFVDTDGVKHLEYGYKVRITK